MAFSTVALPPLTVGSHRLEVTWPFGGAGGIEACYLLGDFGVQLHGLQPRISAPVRHLHWGDATTQGLPFYGGTIRYYVETTLPDQACIEVAHSQSQLVDVTVDGHTEAVWRAPWQAHFANESGDKTITIDCYGNRFNTFGQLHNIDPHYPWWGPNSWRTGGASWSDGYNLKASGILFEPRVLPQ